MKNFILFLFLIPTILSAQVRIDYQGCNCPAENVRAYTPAPCDISGNGVQTNLFMIQIGAYRNFINPKPNVIVVPTNLYNDLTQTNETMYRYFIAALFPTKEEAEQHIMSTNIRQIYCDAIAVPFPFVGVVAFN